MLILSRRVGDAILVEGGIRIVIIACDRKGVRIGVEAPSDVSILREEIVTQITTENQRSEPVLDFWRCPMIPLRDPDARTGHADRFEGIPEELDLDRVRAAVPVGWDLEALAEDCARDGIWNCFVSIKPLNLVGGVGSPANAVAIK